MEKIKGYMTEKITEMRKPEANIEEFKLNGVSMDGVNYLAKIAVSNPLPVSIPICEVDYSLKSDSRVILSGRMPDPGSLRRKDTTVLELQIKVPHSIVKSLVRDVLTDWDIDYELIVLLIVDLPVIGNIKIPINKKGEVKLPSIKDFFRRSGNKDKVKHDED